MGGARKTPKGRIKAAESSGGQGPSKRVAPGLYLVATPIGNMADITLRALEVLAGADVIAAEDTRVTRKLLVRHGIETTLVAYHDHSGTRAREGLLKRLEAGERVALVSDAGTPLISDPGFKLVAAARERGLMVTALPGASSVLTALTLSGLPSDQFFFAGFLPSKRVARRNALDRLCRIPATLVFFESARRLARSLRDMADVLGPRAAAVVREATKKFEEVRPGVLGELADHYDEAGTPKGEVVVVVGPPTEDVVVSDEALDHLLEAALGRLSLSRAVAEVSSETGVARKRVYDRALVLKARS